MRDLRNYYRRIHIYGICTLFFVMLHNTYTAQSAWDLYDIAPEISSSFSPSRPSFHRADINARENQRDAVIVLQGDTGLYGGVLVDEGARTYIYTVLPVIYNNRRLRIIDSQGRVHMPVSMECAKESDLVRIYSETLSLSGVVAATSVQPVSWGYLYTRDAIHDTRIAFVAPYEVYVRIHSDPITYGWPMVDTSGACIGVLTMPYHPVSTNNSYGELYYYNIVRIHAAYTWERVHPQQLTRDTESLRAKEEMWETLAPVIDFYYRTAYRDVIPEDISLPAPLDRWRDDHNAFVHSLSTSIDEYADAAKQIALMEDFLVHIRRQLRREPPASWHLTRLNKRWNKLNEYEETLIRYIQEDLAYLRGE